MIQYKLSIIVFCAVSLLSFKVNAHNFWLQPSAYNTQSSATPIIHFKVGHKNHAESWGLSWERTVSIRKYSSGAVDDLSASLVPASAFLPGSVTPQPLSQGTHIIGYESYHSFSELNAQKFNDYVTEEGLTEVAVYRNANKLDGVSGKEIYSRKAKTIIQVGGILTDNALKPIGQTLEIVPQINPYATLSNSKLPIKVLFRGKPLPNAKVDLIVLDDEAASTMIVQTDDQGVATFTLSQGSEFLLNVVWSVPLINHDKADFETYFASLTFGSASL